MSAARETIFDPADLAWGADRLCLLDLDEEHRGWFENLSRWIEEKSLDDPELHEGCGPPGVEVDLSEAEGRLAGIAEAVGGGADAQTVGATEVEDALARERLEGEKDATVPSRANTAERKAMRLLIERRLSIVRAETEGRLAGLIFANCRGDQGDYRLGYDPRSKTYRCTCPEMRGECSHLSALKMVTVPRGPRA